MDLIKINEKLSKVEYYDQNKLNPMYSCHNSPIPKIDGIPNIDRDYRHWLQSGWINPPIEHWNKENENQEDGPFYVGMMSIDLYNKINHKFENIIRQQNIQRSDITKTNLKVKIMTDNNLEFYKNNKEVKLLGKWVTAELDKVISKIGWYPENPHVVDNNYKLTHKNIWGAIYNSGGYTQPHIHATHLSWVYCVDASDNCSPLHFTMSKMKTFIKPKTGMFVAFPGWLMHHVPVQETDYGRTVIAGNIIIEENK